MISNHQQQKNSNQEKRTIFVGNIPTNLTIEHLYSTFSSFGTILDIQIPTDSQNRNLNRNFGFITFSSQTEALDAIDNMNLNVLPKSIISSLQSSNQDNQEFKILKVNLAKNSFQSIKNSKNLDQNSNFLIGNKNRAIWDDEDWIRENALKDKTDDFNENLQNHPDQPHETKL
ncbi:hypothetical protein O181_023368 [Austropuccinia psidii MF-1]|uniref:RRM domain-containing protein n=1 Tax=Austropuccinia psidii MF-1 TaxID=1389203 RepID=A0A9Q3GX82_9BASI|nr:hypothetical protein [Austropuccinia psidii MF-1]